LRSVYESTILLNGSGEGGVSEKMTAGFVCIPDIRLVIDTIPGGGIIRHVLLRGYLVPDT
jgi:hypothetical protein